MTSLPGELPISETRDHLADVVGRAHYSGEITYITKRGRRVGAIVPVEIAEAAEAAEDDYLSRLARDAEAEVAAGAPTRAFSDVLADLNLGRLDEPADEHTRPAMPAPRGPEGESPSFAAERESRRRP